MNRLNFFFVQHFDALNFTQKKRKKREKKCLVYNFSEFVQHKYFEKINELNVTNY